MRKVNRSLPIKNKEAIRRAIKLGWRVKRSKEHYFLDHPTRPGHLKFSLSLTTCVSINVAMDNKKTGKLTDNEFKYIFDRK